MSGPDLPRAFTAAPLAHRGLHDVGQGRPENSRAAVRAALDAGYGIEVDIQLSRDGEAMVFHDYGLKRLTGREGPVRGHTAAELSDIALLHGDEGIPTLAEILDIVAGRAALLVELKDQDGALGPAVGPLEDRVAALVDGYDGPLALMSFNPHAVARLAERAPEVPRGLTTEAFPEDGWPVAPARLAELRGIPDYDRVGASFISHDRQDLSRDRVAELKAAGAAILCWTVRSLQQEEAARRVADNITFEGYLPAIDGG